jgi:hypothetical protein
MNRKLYILAVAVFVIGTMGVLHITTTAAGIWAAINR